MTFILALDLLVFVLAIVNLVFAVVNKSILNWVVFGLCIGCSVSNFFQHIQWG